MGWRDIVIDNAPSGEPVVTLVAGAASLMARRGGQRVLLSLSDERAYAVAFAVVLQ
jgi:holo-[acyl-carrier protein] synthase